MDAFLLDWLNLLLRWAHMVVGIGWIGTSFYFVWLDLSLRKREQMNAGVYGTSWMVHGGGFYHVEKYAVAPPALPGELHWFKWEAYLTWVTGLALLIVMYWVQASVYLIDPRVAALQPWQAVLISAGSLVAGWVIYDLICRSPLGRNTLVLAVTVFLLVLAAAAFYATVFSGRGAFIHVGAFVGTIMAANVAMVIIPNQKKLVAQLIAGETPDPKYGAIGKQRSMHNSYLTLPVLLMMISNHYPLLTGHPHIWMVIGLVLIVGGAARHAMIRHEAGDHLPKLWPALGISSAALLAALVVTTPASLSRTVAVPPDADVLRITQTHCAACHARVPKHEGFAEAPKGVHLETVADLRRYAQQVMAQAVHSNAMPLGGDTEMSDTERAQLGAWLSVAR